MDMIASWQFLMNPKLSKSSTKQCKRPMKKGNGRGILSVRRKGTWELVKLPKGKKSINSKWYKSKETLLDRLRDTKHGW